MDPKVQEYIAKRKAQIAAAETEEKNKLLAQEGLYEKVYSPEADNSYSPDYPYSEWDEKQDITRYYKKELIEVTDEEYEEIKRAYSSIQKPEPLPRRTVETLLKVIAWITYAAGFIAGLAIKPDGEFSFLIFVASCYSGFVSGTAFLGFAKIIELLKDIKNKAQ